MAGRVRYDLVGFEDGIFIITVTQQQWGVTNDSLVELPFWKVEVSNAASVLFF